MGDIDSLAEAVRVSVGLLDGVEVGDAEAVGLTEGLVPTESEEVGVPGLLGVGEADKLGLFVPVAQAELLGLCEAGSELEAVEVIEGLAPRESEAVAVGVAVSV